MKIHGLNQRAYVICLFGLTILVATTSSDVWPFLALPAVIVTIARVADVLRKKEGTSPRSVR